MKTICPYCKNDDNFHYNYDYGKKEMPIIDILCNECGKIFDEKKIRKEKILKILNYDKRQIKNN